MTLSHDAASRPPRGRMNRTIRGAILKTIRGAILKRSYDDESQASSRHVVVALQLRLHEPHLEV
ncbi:hypothetical protein A9K72_31875 [Mesorhizobium loti]|uniref:Uncharacterized protein n=1 Tax=Mesorhizobium jarvisii TaxID=1777867 RepID=A0AA92XCH2_9HYPH|nr:hypothetical protein A9K72_31875 [Mesorhizobium loti]RJT29307.1 hypothetical protein D3242_28935 [Mesorhizobium jarvisii]